MSNVSRKRSLCNCMVVAILLAGSGCVRRVMQVRSDPPGAEVWLNDREAGRTPFETDFTWYGDFDVVARAEGYQTLKTHRDVEPPWWQFVPLDFVTDFLPLRDDHAVDLKLAPTGVPDPAGVLARGLSLKKQLESSEHTTRKDVMSVRPGTRPATTQSDPDN